MAFAKKGYHILLEKPMAVSLCSDHTLITIASLGTFVLFLMGQKHTKLSSNNKIYLKNEKKTKNSFLCFYGVRQLWKIAK